MAEYREVALFKLPLDGRLPLNVRLPLNMRLPHVTASEHEVVLDLYTSDINKYGLICCLNIDCNTKPEAAFQHRVASQHEASS